MYLSSVCDYFTSRPANARGRRPSRRYANRLRVEALEGRAVPAVIADPAGDFLTTYIGARDPGLDVVAHEVDYLEDLERIVFSGRMAGSVAATQAVGGLYLFGVDRGQGTPRFLTTPPAPPVIGPNVVWDSVLRINPNGTGNFNNLLAGVNTTLNPADIHINGDEFTASVPLSLLTPGATRPPQEWTYNLWPRNGLGQNVQVSDLAPDDGNSPVQTIAPARVESVVVNDGSAQRSMVASLSVTFDRLVTVAPGAFELRQQGGSLVELSVGTSIVNGRTVAAIAFAGLDIVGGSLADGSYTLSIRSDLVHDAFGRSLDGDANGAAGGDHTDAFFRLYGDSDGDRDVDLRDLVRFLGTLGRQEGDPRYLWYSDVNSDGRVDAIDLIAFARRLGSRLES
jgi:Dockerin type I domain